MDQYNRYLLNGEDVYNTYCSSEDKRPIMLPRAPQQKYIDVYPNEDEPGPSFKEDIQHQTNYEAEVLVYRALEMAKEKMVVLHGFEFTHHQYRLCDIDHVRKGCVKCKRAADKDGECDFLIIGVSYVAVIEVKNIMKETGCLTDQRALSGTFRKSVKQRGKIRQLIESMEKNLTFFEFTAYPNFSKKYEDEFKLRQDEKASIMFKEDIDNITSWWQENVRDFILDEPELHNSELSSKLKEVRNMLLAIHCTEKNTFDKDKCSLGRCIKDIDEKLQCGKLTFRKNNPNIVPAPDIFKDFLGIENLTKQQWEVYISNKKLLWIDGPAGGGKSIILIAKIIELVLSKKSSQVILFSFYVEMTYPNEQKGSRLYGDPLKKANIPYEVLIPPDQCTVFGLSSTISRARANTTAKVIVVQVAKLTMNRGITRRWLTEILSLQKGCDIFIDDAQCALSDMSWVTFEEECSYFMNILSHISNSNHVWLAFDVLQMFASLPMGITKESYRTVLQFNKLLSEENCITIDTNLRNTYDMSCSLSIIRDHFRSHLGVKAFFCGGLKLMSDDCKKFARTFLTMEQANGHYIHGPKTMIHTFYCRDHDLVTQIFDKEVNRLNNEKALYSSDSIIIGGNMHNTFFPKEILTHVHKMLDKNYQTYKWAHWVGISSAEWPAVILVHEMSSCPLIDIGILYLAMSRARVYCSVILIPGVLGTLHLDEYYDMFTVLHKLEKMRLVEIIEHGS